MSLLARIRQKLALFGRIEARLSRMQEAIGRIEGRQLRAMAPVSLQDYEFQVYSQWGEDGILQRLVETVPVGRKVFVEFGVENYTEANTRFLLVNGNWAGLVMDGSDANVARIVSDPLYWRHNLKAVRAFVTRENINALLTQNGLEGEIGLLSIDIDGNDYWVWEAITSVRPRVVACEYNPTFGRDVVTIPYDAAFSRYAAHHSGLYYGASLAALEHLGRRKGYVLVGCNTSGTNAFFVRDDLAPPGLAIEAGAACVESNVRQSRDPEGRLTFVRGSAKRALIAHLAVVDVETGAVRLLG